VSGFELISIFYRPTDHGIEVARVLHGARDIARIFGRKR
jgi:plasmid stabilization system protein ParE